MDSQLASRMAYLLLMALRCTKVLSGPYVLPGVCSGIFLGCGLGPVPVMWFDIGSAVLSSGPRRLSCRASPFPCYPVELPGEASAILLASRMLLKPMIDTLLRSE